MIMLILSNFKFAALLILLFTYGIYSQNGTDSIAQSKEDENKTNKPTIDEINKTKEPIASNTCCSNCLNSPAVLGVDALDFSKCTKAQTPCCFENQCRQSQFPAYKIAPNAITYKSGKATMKSGSYVAIKWADVEDLTFILIQEEQEKTIQPKYNSEAAELIDDYFQFCAASPGVIYFRGFRKGGCEASTEFSIQVLENNGKTCTDATIISEPTETECNLARGSVKDGECVCTSDYSGPPDCNGTPIWKWLVPILGGVAGVVSIAVSIHAFLQRRKRMKENRDSILLSSSRSNSLNTPPYVNIPPTNPPNQKISSLNIPRGEHNTIYHAPSKKEYSPKEYVL